MSRWVEAPYVWLAGAAALAWAALIMLVASGAGWDLMAFRVVLVVIAGALGATIWAGPAKSLVLSPLYLLGLVAVVFYSMLPAIYFQFPESLKVDPRPHEMTLAYHGGLGEMLVLQFAAFCFALSALGCHFLQRYGSRAELGPIAPSSTAVRRAATALILVIVFILVANRHLAPVKALLSGGIGREFHDALIPLLSFCLAALGYMAAFGDRRHTRTMLAMAAFVLVGMTAAGLGRITIFVVLSPLLLMLAIGDVTWKVFVKFAAAAIALVLVSIVSLGLLRPLYQQGRQGFESAASLELIKLQIVSKLVARQAISGWCFDRVARDHLASDNPGRPFFFAIAIVPRVLWPAKPSLSRGSVYAEKYCGQIINPAAPHSESLTLLGEPVLNAGATGIAVAQAFLGASLLLATFLAFRGGAPGIVCLTAMVPWLTVFEQHFALYTANSVKMFLFMLPLVVALILFRRGSVRRA